jgi:Helicase associated domain
MTAPNSNANSTPASAAARGVLSWRNGGGGGGVTAPWSHRPGTTAAISVPRLAGQQPHHQPVPLVPKSYTVDGYPLGQWVRDQRNFHSKGTLDADRERRPQDLPGWTWDAVGEQ